MLLSHAIAHIRINGEREDFDQHTALERNHIEVNRVRDVRDRGLARLRVSCADRPSAGEKNSAKGKRTGRDFAEDVLRVRDDNHGV
jgi:hypothetical protein